MCWNSYRAKEIDGQLVKVDASGEALGGEVFVRDGAELVVKVQGQRFMVLRKQ